MADRTILLHIGAPKCGSTFIQNVLLNNFYSLNKIGINYPRQNSTHPGNGLEIKGMPESRLEALFSPGIHTLVFSHEDLLSKPAIGSGIVELAKSRNMRIKALVFLRPFSELVYGDYSQHMKQYFELYLANRDPYLGLSFEEFVERRHRLLTLNRFLTQWRRMIGKENLILGSHLKIRPIIERTLKTDSALDWELPSSRRNISLRVEDCDLIAAAIRNREIPENTLRRLLRNAYKSAGKPDRGKTAQRTDFIEKLFSDQYQKIEANFNFNLDAGQR